MKIVVSRFLANNDSVIGLLKVFNSKNECLFKCFTLELTWKGNQRKLSHIPSGKYECVKIKSSKFGDCLSIKNVKDRSNILFHYGNYSIDTAGCLLVGDSFTFGGSGHTNMVMNSIRTLNKLLEFTEFTNKLLIESIEI